MNNRQRMNNSRHIAVEELISRRYNDIWFKSSTNKTDTIYTQDKRYLANSLWNLFDGICFVNNRTCYIKINTNKWPDEKPIKQFLKTHYIHVIAINVTNRLKDCDGKFKAFVREYS